MSSATSPPIPFSKHPPPDIVWRFNDDPMAKTTHTGGSHCGAIRFSFQHEPLNRHPGFHIPIKACNCSICAKSGYLTIFPTRDEITWEKGEGEMKTYTYASGLKKHRFCGTCGNSVCMDLDGAWMSWAGDVVEMNVRMLDDFDIEILHLHKKNGKDYAPKVVES